MQVDVCFNDNNVNVGVGQELGVINGNGEKEYGSSIIDVISSLHVNITFHCLVSRIVESERL